MPDSLNPLIAKCPPDYAQANAYLAGVKEGMRLERYHPEREAKRILDLLSNHVFRIKRDGGTNAHK